MRPFALALLAAASLGLVACSGSDPVDPTPVDLEVETAANVYAPQTGQPGQPAGGGFTFYSLQEGRVVLAADATPRTDSASTEWDIAFRGTTILINGGTSGPGEGGAQILTAAFDEVTEAPAEGYEVDNGFGDLAIPTGSGNGWYTYTPAQNLITPTAGRVLVIRTANGNYAKVRILSYYQNSPNPVDTAVDAPRYYTFEYVYQPDGSRNFETTTATD